MKKSCNVLRKYVWTSLPYAITMLCVMLVSCSTKSPRDLDKLKLGYKGVLAEFENISMEKAGLSGNYYNTLNKQQTDQWNQYWCGNVLDIDCYVTGIKYMEKDDYYGLPEAQVLIYQSESSSGWNRAIAQAYCVKVINHQMKYIEDIDHEKARVRGVVSELGENQMGNKMIVIVDAECELYK